MRLTGNLLLIMVTIYCERSNAENYQQGAKIQYVNPEYVTNVRLVTTRKNRHSPYLTSFNGTTLHPWGNNVTAIAKYHEINGKTEGFEIELKVCDFMKIKWNAEWVKNTFGITRCPIPAGPLFVSAFEFPPKNFPFFIPNGDYKISLTYLLTATRMKIIEGSVTVKVKN